ncbi:MAG TPA: hypothetical protein VGC65_03355 [Bacteroidia bacterium]|jgi:hypothetical protein
MQQRSIFLTIVLAFNSFFLSGQNSAPKKDWHFAFGVCGAVNNTRDVDLFADDRRLTIDSPRAFKLGGEGKVIVGYVTQKRQILLGFGYSDNVTQYNFNGIWTSKGYLRFQYKFYTATLSYNWLIGKQHKWVLGADLAYGLMFHFTDHGHRDSQPTPIDYGRYYKTPQNTYWLGLTFGRLFPLNEHFEIGTFFNTKASSLVRGTNAAGSKTKTFDRNFLVYTLNFNLTYKI